jgi:hypothetical protein
MRGRASRGKWRVASGKWQKVGAWATMDFYLVRHAHAEWVPDEGRSLSEQGLRDAVLVAELLAERPIEAVYSSPYRRAIQTVSGLAIDRKLQVQIEDRFRERTWASGRQARSKKPSTGPGRTSNSDGPAVKAMRLPKPALSRLSTK